MHKSHLGCAGGQGDAGVLGRVLQPDGHVGGDVQHNAVSHSEADEARLLHHGGDTVAVWLVVLVDWGRGDVGGEGWGEGHGGHHAGQGVARGHGGYVLREVELLSSWTQGRCCWQSQWRNTGWCLPLDLGQSFFGSHIG